MKDFDLEHPCEGTLLTELETEYNLRDGLLHNKVQELKAFSRKCEESEALMSIFMKAKDATPDSQLGQMMSIATNGNPMLCGTILGKLAGEAASVEAERRKAITDLYTKFGYNKSCMRDMLIGYYVDDDGIATYPPDKDGNRKRVLVNGKPEQAPGEFLKYHIEALHGYDKYELVLDGNGRAHKRFYCDLEDQDRRFVVRIYKDDIPAIKETLANWDMLIKDPITDLYGILSGINEGDIMVDGLEGVGLARFASVIAQAGSLDNSHVFTGPIYASMVCANRLNDYVHRNLAHLMSLAEYADPDTFSALSFVEFEHIRLLTDPANWDGMLFDEESLYSFRDINGKFLDGTQILRSDEGKIIRDSDGRIMTKFIPYEGSTHEDLINTVIAKYLVPAGSRLVTMMNCTPMKCLHRMSPDRVKSWLSISLNLLKWNRKEISEKYPLIEDPANTVDGSKIELELVRYELSHLRDW